MRTLEAIVFWALVVVGLVAFGVRLVIWLAEAIARWMLGPPVG